jgi:protein O-mannosyl-transferase
MLKGMIQKLARILMSGSVRLWTMIGLTALTLTLALIYGNVIVSQPLLSYEDPFLILPMKEIGSYSQYLEARKSGLIIDLQPLRDLSFWLDYRLSDSLGFHSVHSTNLLIWIGIALAVFSLLSFLGGPLPLRLFLTAYVAFHPVAVNSVAWGAARKHLLAAFFISWATVAWFKAVESREIRYPMAAILLFGAACASQPIAAGWVLWASIYWLYRRDRIDEQTTCLFALVTCVVIAEITFVSNFRYYNSPEFKDAFGGISKIAAENVDRFADRLLVMGRYVIQLFFPIQPSLTPYSPKNPLNLVGVILLPVVGYALFKRVPRRPLLIWTTFILFPMVPILAGPNSNPGWDVYLLIPLVGTAVLIHSLIMNLNPTPLDLSRNGSWTVATALTLLVCFATLSYRHAQSFTSSDRFWKKSVELEPTATNMLAYAQTQLLENQSSPLALDLALRAAEISPNHRDLGYVLGFALYSAKDTPLSNRLLIFNRMNLNSPWFLYYWAALESMAGLGKNAESRLRSIWEHYGKETKTVFSDSVAKVAANWYELCRSLKQNDCDQNLQVIKSLSGNRWSDQLFKESLDVHRLPSSDHRAE